MTDLPDPLEPTPAFQERVLAGRALAEDGNFEAAEAHFRVLLTEAREGIHEGNVARAISSLTTLYGRAGRYLETHMLGRHLAGMAHQPGAEPTLAFAYGSICGALSQLRLVAPLRAALDEMRAAMLQLAPERRAYLELEYQEAALGLAVNEGRAPEARRHLNAFRAALQDRGTTTPLDEWVGRMSDAQIALLEGRADVALGNLQQVRSEQLTPPHHRLQEKPLTVAVHAALGQLEHARASAHEAIEILESVEDEPFLASDRIHQGNLLATELERLGELDLVHRVYDLVAAAVVIRLRQVDECSRELPQLGLGDEESIDALAEFRRQFVREQSALLERVAQLLESRGGDHIRTLLAASAPEGLVAVCAWCERVRPSADRWVPIGHFLPRSGRLKLTHSICPGCAERWSDAG